MDLTKGKEKAAELLNKISAALRDACTVLTGKIDSFADRLLGRYPEEKRRPMLLALGGLAALFLILVISILAASLQGPKKNAPV